VSAEDELLPKPDELLALHGVTDELFDTLRRWFDVPTHATIDLTAVDSAVTELGDPTLIAAMAMRKLQALHLLTTPGVVTTTDVVLTVIQDLERALLQAPSMHLRDTAATTDWDAELAALDDGDATRDAAVEPAADDDDEITLFRTHHAALHDAARAVLHASDGRIRRLV
jgi:hypothetical protein